MPTHVTSAMGFKSHVRIKLSRSPRLTPSRRDANRPSWKKPILSCTGNDLLLHKQLISLDRMCSDV